MMHTVQNTDGSFTTVDTEDDGMFMYWMSVFFEKWAKKKEDQVIKEFPFYCSICDMRFAKKSQCVEHIRKVEKMKVDKNGVPI